MTRGLGLVLALGLCAAQTAHAEKIAILESYPLARPPEAAQLMAPMLEYYTASGHAAGPVDLGKRLEEKFSLPGRQMTPDEASETKAQVDKGYRAWIQGNFDEAVNQLGSAITKFMSAPATMAQEPARRELLFKALVYKAMAHRRRGETDQATATMAELLRSFPDTQVSRSSHGPEAFEFYQAVRQDTGTRGRGTLIIEVDDESVVIFLNERYEGVGKLTKTDLLPGEYRVFVRKGSIAGRLHKIVVEPNKEARVDIDWLFDSTLVTGPDWVGFAFPTRKLMQTHEAEFVGKIGLVVGFETVIAHSVEVQDGRQSIIGRTFSVQLGKYGRLGYLPTEPVLPAPEELQKLASFVSGGKLEGSVKSGQISDRTDPPSENRPSNPYTIPAWSTAAVAVGTVGFGVFLILRDGNCAESGPAGTLCPTVYDTLLPGIGFTVGGAAIGGLSTWFFLKQARWKRERPRMGLAPTRGGAIVTFGGQF